MHWNYRVVDLTGKDDNEPRLEVCEVYYSDLGLCNGWCTSAYASYDIEGLKGLSTLFLEAMEKPIFKLSDFIEIDDNY